MSPQLVSVVMPVHNAERYVAEAVQSILAQRFGDFEFIIVDDGSTDGSLDILKRYAKQDSRIKLTSRPNTGIVGALNEMVSRARGEFIARMDADDISVPDRFGIQVEYLADHPRCGLVGSWAEWIDEDGEAVRPCPVPTSGAEIDAANMNGPNAVVHPSVMIRRDLIIGVGGYRAAYWPAEDRDLWLRVAEVSSLANIPEVLLRYRLHTGSTCQVHTQRQRDARHRCVADACRRRGTRQRDTQQEPQAGSDERFDSLSELIAWWALSAGNQTTARKHAWRAWRTRPFSVRAWRVLVCCLRGH